MSDVSPLDQLRYQPTIDGLVPGTDRSSLIVGTITGLDATKKQVQVKVGTGDPLWVPAAPDIYIAGTPVRLLRSPIDGGRVVYCLGALDTQPEVVTGVVTAVNSGAGTLTVTVLGASYVLPYPVTTVAVNDVVYVVRSVKRFGAPLFVLGKTGATVAGTAGPGGGNANPGQGVSRQSTVAPQWSGTWRNPSGWDQWNTDRYGGRSTLWQGNAYGSGALTGLAAYGDQIVNLQAASITAMRVHVIRADSSDGAGKFPGVQGSPHGSQPGGAPSGSGAITYNGAPTPEQSTDIDLPSSVFENFRTGAFKGLLITGTDYGGFYGTARGDGMAITIQYTIAV